MRRLAALWRNRRDDRGFTLTELLVSMAILSIVMVVVTGAILQASSTSARVDAAGVSQQQAHQAFDRLDRQVRWAAAFGTQGTVAGNPYVEWLYTASGAPTCNELRIDVAGKRLQQRSWKQGDLTTVTPWTVVASGITGVAIDANTSGFRVFPSDATFPMARLRIAVTSTAGGAKATDTATHDVTYTALNSSGSTVPATVCSEGRTVA